MARSEFLSHMSHELRTPLGGVIGLTDLLLRESPDESQRPLLQQSRDSAARLPGLLNSVLDLAKIEAGAMELEEAPFELVELVEESAELVRPSAEAKGLRVLLELETTGPSWRTGDALRLKQCVVNLLGNAIKFTEHGHVCLRLTAAERDGVSWVRLDIEDTGEGMTEAQLARLFVVFQQGNAGVARRHGGTGLGLTITRQVVELAGGQVSVESEPGVGACFSLELPLARAEAPRVFVGEVVTASIPSGLRVLVAEDNPVNQLVVRRMLSNLGARVTLVDDGNKEVAAAMSGTFDVVLMDVQMPELDGRSATTQLRAQGFTAPVLGLTAHAFKEEQDACRDAGVNDVLLKPIDQESLGRALSAWIAARRSA